MPRPTNIKNPFAVGRSSSREVIGGKRLQLMTKAERVEHSPHTIKILTFWHNRITNTMEMRICEFSRN